MEDEKEIKRPKKDFNFSFLKGTEKIEYIKNHTNGLNNIDLNEVKQLEADMEGDVVRKELQNVRELAQRFDITGTPYLIIGEQAFPGAIPYSRIVDALK